MLGLGLLPKRVLSSGFGSPTQGSPSRAPDEVALHVVEGLGRCEQYPPLGSAQGGEPCSTKVSHPSPLSG